MASINGLEDMNGQDLSLALQKGGKFVVYRYCISIIIMTFRRGSSIYFIKPGESPIIKGLPYTLLTLLLGWWGIPWGPIFTVQALINNFQGGKDVTTEVLGSLRKAAMQQPITGSVTTIPNQK